MSLQPVAAPLRPATIFLSISMICCESASLRVVAGHPATCKAGKNPMKSTVAALRVLRLYRGRTAPARGAPSSRLSFGADSAESYGSHLVYRMGKHRGGQASGTQPVQIAIPQTSTATERAL